MKKFGTPIGAGPGIENEKLGLAAVGTPFFWFGVGGLAEGEVLVEGVGPVEPDGPVFLGPVGPLLPLLPPPPPPPPPWCLPPPFGLEDEGPVGELVVPVVLGGEEPVETVGAGEEELAGAHEAEALFTGPTPAGIICAAGVPDGTLTLKLSVCPVSRVTVTVHWSADALGSAAIPMTANTDAAVAAAILSFRCFNNLT